MKSSYIILLYIDRVEGSLCISWKSCISSGFHGGERRDSSLKRELVGMGYKGNKGIGLSKTGGINSQGQVERKCSGFKPLDTGQKEHLEKKNLSSII